MAARELQQAVNGQVFTFTHYVEVLCNFKGYKEKVKFYLVDKLPHPFLFGYRSIFLVLSLISEKPIISLLPTSATDGEKTLSLFGANNIFCSMTADISDEAAQLKLQQLLQEFDSIFDPNDKSPAKHQ